MSSEEQSPISSTEADGALRRLAPFDRVVLAVSGGPDSMALLVLVAEWSARRTPSGPAISVATVDHRLRPQSADEAEFVGREAKRFGLAHAVLPWEGEKPRTGLAEAAREARYRLLESLARSFGAEKTAVVTAHHLDDQAETFAMRLARGAGIDGLAAMKPERRLLGGSPVMLLRPLVNFPKSRLLVTVKSRDMAFVEDPSNRDVRSERVRVRQALPALDTAGIGASALATSARRLNDAAGALAYAEERFVATLDMSFGNEVFAAFDRLQFASGPAFLRQRVLSRLIARFGGASPKPRLSEIEDLTTRIETDGQCTATLGGAMISAGRRFVRIWREAGRLDHRGIDLSPGDNLIWDQRFLIQCLPDLATPVVVKPLGVENYLEIANRLAPGGRPPAQAAHALPSFWTGAGLIAVPSLAPFASAQEPPFATYGGFKCQPLSLAY